MYREKPWCFVSDPDIEWEYCDIPYCHNLGPLECKNNRQGKTYMGTKNVTKAGHPCQLWMRESPNPISSHGYYWNAGSFLDDLHPSHNFCRNPDGDSGGLWCFNGAGTDPVWEYCDIKLC
ncbi:unnamed protein product [Darwinula stevensoni]|uniref:Kringle domain-containing protein n=1 Tax=Darwinula stevensoni TaxID=69355 RepID=A0A7R9AHT6_9CRUS|nr:unnamed protein product [Darwinula stevensoni]CAG0905392.1 unnamed protein product [Darwinula stevensoni]